MLILKNSKRWLQDDIYFRLRVDISWTLINSYRPWSGSIKRFVNHIKQEEKEASWLGGKP